MGHFSANNDECWRTRSLRRDLPRDETVIDKRFQPQACGGEVEEALEREDGLS